MSLSDSRPRPCPWLCIPAGRWGGRPLHLPGLPGSSTALSLRATPNHPGRLAECPCSLLPRRWQASASLADWPPSNSVTRPNRVRLRCGSQVCLTGFHQPDYSDPLRLDYTYERAIYMVSSLQLTRAARLSLVFQRRGDKERKDNPHAKTPRRQVLWCTGAIASRTVTAPATMLCQT